MRLSSKAFLVDPEGRLLLLDSTDPADPGTSWWELPGGGLEDGEDEVDALLREVLEETGLAIRRDGVGPVVWTQESTFTWLGRRHYSRCHGRIVRVDDLTLVATALTPDERGTILGQRWWTQQELTGFQGRFFPRNLPALLPRVLAGELVDEPFDHWS